MNCLICRKHIESPMGKITSHFYCDDCGIGRIKKIPQTTYAEEYYVSGSSLLSKLFHPLANIFFWVREQYVGFYKKKVYVDVGAGEGNFLSHVHAERRIGVEVSPSGRLVMKKKGLSVMTNEEFLKKKNIHADVISFWHVLEHVSDPLTYLKAAKNNLSPSGTLVIAVPNGNSIERTLFGKYWFHLAPQYHIWFFSPYSLMRLIESIDMKVKRIDYFAVEHHPTGLLQSCINATTNTDNILHKLVRRKQDLASISVSQGLLIAFWCTIGLPIVFITWVTASIVKRPGAFVMVASK